MLKIWHLALPPALLLPILSGQAWLIVPAALVLLAWLPGRLALSALSIAGGCDRVGRMIVSVAWSLALAPVFLNPLWHWTNDGPRLLLASAAILAASAIAVYVVQRRAPAALDEPVPFAARKRTRILLVLIVVVLVIGTIGSYWPDEVSGYPVPAVIHDYIKHHAVLFSMEQKPLPLGNPFFARGAAQPTVYYHYFYLLPATLRAATGNQLSIALAFGLASCLVALALTGAAYLLAQRWCGGEAPATLVALLCGTIGGFDALALLMQGKLAVTLDAWADTPLRIHNLLTQFIWTPQNMLGLLIALLGAALLRTRGWWRGWLVAGPLLCHALLGSSIWISTAVLPGIVLLVVVELWQRLRSRQPFGRLFAGAALTALLMLLAALPLLRDYAEVSRRHGKGLTTVWEGHSWNSVLGWLAPAGPLANALDYPWVLLVEFGPLLIVPLLMPKASWRHAWQNPALRFFMLTSGLVLAVFPVVRSHFTYNDFGHRIIMIPMLTGALLAGFAISPHARRPRWFNPVGWTMAPHTSGPTAAWRGWLLAACIVLGSPGSWWQTPAGALRRFAAYLPALRPLGTPSTQAAFADRGALRFLRHGIPPAAVVQAHVGPERLELAQLVNRQIGVMPLEQDTHVFQGPTPDAQLEALREFERQAGSDSGDSSALQMALHRLRVTHVLVGQIERERWRRLDRFHDEARFEKLFESSDAVVFRVRSQ